MKKQPLFTKPCNHPCRWPDGLCAECRALQTMFRIRHLFAGTHQENILDAQKKGRMGKYGHKVKAVLEMAAAGMKPLWIAASLDVNFHFVYRVLKKESFKLHSARF